MRKRYYFVPVCTRAQEVPHFIMHAAKPGSCCYTLKAPHRPDPLFDSSMVLLQMIIQLAADAVVYLHTEHGFDRARIGVMSITGNPRREVLVQFAESR